MKEKLSKINQILIKYHVYYYLLMVILLALDLITKKVIEGVLLLKENSAITVIKGFFTLRLVYNTGAFSGVLGSSLFGRIILVLLSLVCGVIMIFYFTKAFKKLNMFEKIGISLAASGTIGNLVDRFLMICNLQEGVIDFLEFNLGFMVWNVFNLADSFLVIGVILFGIGFFIKDFKESKKEQEKREAFYNEKKDPNNDDSNNQKGE